MRLRGTRRMLVLVLPALALTLSVCDWPEFGLWNTGGRDSPDVGINMSNVASTTPRLDGHHGRRGDSSPAVVNGIVYVGSDDGKVYVLKRERRGRRSGRPAPDGAAGVVTDGRQRGFVYVGSDDDNVYALNATTGATLWTDQHRARARSGRRHGDRDPLQRPVRLCRHRHGGLCVLVAATGRT